MPNSKKNKSAASPEPVFKGTIEGWTVNHIAKNLWRVECLMSFDDCLQEAQLVFLRVKRTYPTIGEGPHFMSLYQTSLTRRFHDLSMEATALREHELPQAIPDLRVGDTANEGELRVMLRQAPREVRMVLDLFLRAPQEIADLAFAGWRKDRQKGSDRINALLGLPPGSDSLQRVEDYFRQ